MTWPNFNSDQPPSDSKPSPPLRPDSIRGRNNGSVPTTQHPDVARRVRELDSENDPLSIPEQIVMEGRRGGSQAAKPSSLANTESNIEAISPPRRSLPTKKLIELQQMSIDELRSYACEVLIATVSPTSTISDASSIQQPVDNREAIDAIRESSRQELVSRLLKHQFKSSGLMFGEGTLEILPDGFGFLRSSKSHYLSCSDDIYVSPSQIRRFGLETGVMVSGQVRPPKENERYFALLRIEAINYQDPGSRRNRVPFDALTALHPQNRIVLETDSQTVETRVLDLLSPLGFGQRGLIVAPPRAGKTVLLQKMARAVLQNYPDAYVILLLIDERPEEVTDMQREVRGPQCEVISSTFDETSARHIQVSNMVLEKAKRLVEHGRDVVIFLDSITRLARAWNSECEQSGKLLTGGLDANALQKPKAFFGAARKVEGQGSLTIIATALVETGSKMDEVIFEEFKGTGNLEIVLDRSLVDKRIWPAVNLHATGTRREEMLLDPEEHRRIGWLRRAFSEVNSADAMEMLVQKLSKTKTNAEFLLSMRNDR